MELTAYHHLTQQLLDNVSADTRVLGLIALGSMAEINRTPDDWSDHDFFLITTAGEQEHFRQDLRWLPNHDQIALSIRETAHGLKVLYAGGHLLEFAVFDVDELKQDIKLNDYRMLLDRADLTPLLHAQAQRSADQPTRDLYRDLAMVIALVYVGAGRYARGEYLSAHIFIKHHLLHHLLPLLAECLPTADRARLDNLDPFRRFEMVFPEAGHAVHRALLLPPVEAAEQLLTLAAAYSEPVLTDSTRYPHHAIQVVREYLKAIQAGLPPTSL